MSPDLSYQQPACAGHLLRHTSGIDAYLYLWHPQLGHHEHDVVTQAQALELIRRADDVAAAGSCSTVAATPASPHCCCAARTTASRWCC